MIKQKNSERITFVADSHEYFKGNIKYVSATTLKKAFVPKFDKDYWSLYTAIRLYLGKEKEGFSTYLKETYGHNIKHKDLGHLEIIAGLIHESIFDKAKEVANNWENYKIFRGQLGSKYHAEKELEAYQNGYDTIGMHEAQIQGIYSYDLKQLKDGFYSELLLYVDHIFDRQNNIIDARISGQADKVIITTDGKTRWVDIDDYKTCAKISTENKFQKMLYPLDKFEACDVMEFAVQLNIYGFLLEEWGFKVRSLRFTHCMINEQNGELLQEKIYHLPIFTPLIRDLIVHYRKTNKVITI